MKSRLLGVSRRIWIVSSLTLAGAVVSPFAVAAIACAGGPLANSVSATTPVSGNLDFSGLISFTCTRLTTDLLTQTVYIGINIGENPDGSAATGTDREMTRQTGLQQINYSVFRNSTPSGAWTSGTGRALGNTATGGLQTAITFSAGATSQAFSFPYYIRVLAASWSAATAPAGIYDDLGLLATLRLNNSTGAIQGSPASFGVTMSKPSHCYFSVTPGNISMSYISLSTSPVTASSNYSINCTNSTTYTMALNSSNGVLVGLQYTLALSATGTRTGSGFQQNYTVNATIPAGQAGTCASGSCSATSAVGAHVVTITY